MGGINSCNDRTRQEGDEEWKHFDDTVYGGDFLNHQPPCKEMADWAPRIIDLMDRLGVTFNRSGEGYLDYRRFGGTLFRRAGVERVKFGESFQAADDWEFILQVVEAGFRFAKGEGTLWIWRSGDWERTTGGAEERRVVNLTRERRRCRRESG